MLRLLIGQMRRCAVFIRGAARLRVFKAAPHVPDLLPERFAYRELPRQLCLEFGVLFGDPLLPREALRRNPLLRTAKRRFGIGEATFELITPSRGVVDLRGQFSFTF